jgi:hypothetical protein
MKTIPTDGQDLEGKTVLLSAEHYRGDEKARLFRCEDGFGLRPYLRGQGVMGTFLVDGEQSRVERWQIEGIVVEEPAT